MDFQGNDSLLRVSTEASFNDQYFLLNFIMSTYLGPDVYSDYPRCSASQRLGKGLPPYSSKNLGSSFVSISQLESLYYYVLRNAHPSLILKPNVFYKYVKGTLHLPSSGMPEGYRQFTSYFPLNLHEQKRCSGGHEVVKGIVLIDDPAISYIKEEDLGRFKRLSEIEDLRIDRIKSLCYQHEQKNREENVEQNTMKNGETVAEDVSNENGNLSAKPQEQCKRKRQYDPPLLPALPHTIPMSNQHSEEGPGQGNRESDGPVLMPLLTAPKVQHFVSDASITLTGTAAKGIAGPPLGVLDIGIGKSAYFFQVALPGVRRDYSEFSCEIESDGKVHIRGYTTGGKTIKKRSRVFHMKYQQLCPPGQFTLSFSLPGPVDPRLFSPNFRSDGILEGVIIKH